MHALALFFLASLGAAGIGLTAALAPGYVKEQKIDGSDMTKFRFLPDGRILTVTRDGEENRLSLSLLFSLSLSLSLSPSLSLLSRCWRGWVLTTAQTIVPPLFQAICKWPTAARRHSSWCPSWPLRT
jgi:hypothetical protein